jgi:hypothetical protein
MLIAACVAVSTAKDVERWQIGMPIATYYAGPEVTDAIAKQMADAGFNLIWVTEANIDIAHKYGLRALLHAPELSPATLRDPAQRARLDALIDRVKNHPALYGYYIIDEPSAGQFPGYGALVTYLRERDPSHLAYLNLFPTYANNEQLGTQGDTVTAYKEHLRLYIEQVKPDLLSYDHYHFTASGHDGDQYFLNLAMIRRAALDAGIPFMNIVQGCTWDPGMRAPNADEMRFLNYTSLAYGAQALSYFVYYHEPFYHMLKEKVGMMMWPDGSTTAQYAAAKELNPQFIAIARELQPLRSLGAYHAGVVPWGAEALPEGAPFTIEFTGEGQSTMPAEGMLLGYFGNTPGKPTHALVVNLSYKHPVTATIVGPSRLSVYNVFTRKWQRASGRRVTTVLPPGAGQLVRIK